VRFVVLRCVKAVAGIEGERRILDQRGRRQVATFEGERVEEGFQRRAGLAQRGDAIDFGRTRQVAARSDPGQHFAAGIVEDQHGAILDVLSAQRRQVAAQGFGRKDLQAGIEAGAQLLAGLAEQLAGQVRRQLLTRIRRFGLAAVQRAGGETLQAFAFAAALDFLEQVAGAFGNQCRAGVGRAEQGGGEGRFAFVEAVRPLAEELAAHRADALKFAAEADQVEIGLDDLPLVPGTFQAQGGCGLAELAEQAAPAAPLAVLVEQAGQLHAQCAGAARPVAPEVAPCRLAGSLPIDAVVLHETFVFRDDDGTHQGR